ncbi:hypothetical protein IPG41_04795 [Candidatus Peregrinibacteria bacterium]|nr:MAG: hypothetical protein IPG41_04795 [Candidatus Peregrinibacteria bacterium]
MKNKKLLLVLALVLTVGLGGPAYYLLSGGDAEDFMGRFGPSSRSNPSINNSSTTGTATVNPDTDRDGLTDNQEIQGVTVNGYRYTSNPGVMDTDSDGLIDYAEVMTHQSNPAVVDTDGDSLRDGDEVNTHHTRPDLMDSDGDGLEDNLEVQIYGTDPTLWDSDGDGVADPEEIRNGTDPLNDDEF